MNVLRVEADESAAKVEELTTKVKSLEHDNMAKEQEITSLSHKNQVLEQELEKIESSLKDAKASAEQSAQHDTHNESLTRRLQVLETEVEKADAELKSTSDKCVSLDAWHVLELMFTDYVKRMSGRVTLSVKCRPSRRHAISMRQSTRRWPKSTQRPKRSSTTLWPRLAQSSFLGLSLQCTEMSCTQRYVMTTLLCTTSLSSFCVLLAVLAPCRLSFGL